MNVRLFLLKIASPISQWISSVHAPWTRKELRFNHVLSAMEHLKPGCIILSYTKGELASVFIPGKWKHAAIYCGMENNLPYLIEAKTSGVTRTDIPSFFWNKDAVAILVSTFCSEYKMSMAADIAHKYIGKPYDMYFAPGDKALYCSELIALSYAEAVGDEVFGKRERLGVKTILPDDYAQATKKWRIVWDSTQKKVDANIAGQQTAGLFITTRKE